MYSSVAISTFTGLWNHYHHPSTELFSYCKTQALYLLNINSTSHPFPCQWQPLFYFLPLWIYLTTLGICMHAQSRLTLCDPYGLQPARNLFDMGFPREEYRSCCHSLLQGIFLTQGPNSGILHRRQVIYLLSHQGKPKTCTDTTFKIIKHITASEIPNGKRLYYQQIIKLQA